jgi:hypothetical protein
MTPEMLVPSSLSRKVMDAASCASVAGVGLQLIAEHPELASRNYDYLAPQCGWAQAYLLSAGVGDDVA